MIDETAFAARLSTVLAQIAPGELLALNRLSGGANMESWSIDWGMAGAPVGYILRRAPSAEWMEGRPFGLEDEAALVRAARAGGVLAPQVVGELTPADDLGQGYIMLRVEAAVNPAVILAEAAPTLIDDIAREMARVHALPMDGIPAAIPLMDTATALTELKARFISYGADRPIIALALRWLEEHLPAPVAPSLVHGDFRLGNIMATPNGLAAVLDWELAHRGDAHEDLAFGCMTVWRFGQIDRPAFGLSDLDRYFAAYEAAGGQPVDWARFAFWLVYRTTWWALGCLQMGEFWRSGVDRSFERTVISRRTSENELDLLMLLEGEASAEDQAAPLPPSAPAMPDARGETSAAEILAAMSDWMNSDLKPKASGRDKFMVVMAMNALGMVRRELMQPAIATDKALADALLAGDTSLATPGLLPRLRRMALDKLANDVPKYAALAKARTLWERPTAE